MSVSVVLGGKHYSIAPDMRLVCEIEEELGGIADLARRFREGMWEARELVSLTHMILHAAGSAADYGALGDRMVAEGLGPYADGVLRVLERILGGGKA